MEFSVRRSSSYRVTRSIWISSSTPKGGGYFFKSSNEIPLSFHYVSLRISPPESIILS